MRFILRGVILLWCTMAVAPDAISQQARESKAADIVARVEHGHDGIQDYTVTLDVVADIDRLSVPPMHATMYFKQPDKVHFESTGFLLLPREGMVYNLAALRSRYTVLEPAVRDTFQGQTVYRITLEPRKDRRKAPRLFVLVNPSRWTVEKVMSEPSDGRALSGDFRYVQVERWWLPAELTVRFSVAQADSAGGDVPEPPVPAQRPQLPRTGSLTIRYSDYRVNGGLSDDMFPPPQEQK